MAYAAANVNSVNGTYTEARYGQYDGWVVKTDGSGNLQWQKLLGTNLQDFFNGVQQTSDGGYILTGQASSGAPNQGSLTGLTFNGSYDGWIVKLDGGGDVQWQELLGGFLDENLIAVQQTSDGGYFAAGYSSSSNTGTLASLTNNGGIDGWTVKLTPNAAPKKPGSGNSLLFSNTTATSVDIGKRLDFAGSFSFEAWVKRSTLTDTDPNGEAFVSSGAFGGWGIGFNNNSNPIPHTIEFGKVGTSEVNSTSVVYDLKWHHIAVTYDAVAHQVKFYIDGILDATVAYSPTDFNSGNSDYSIGALTSTTSNYLKGNIDEIRIWNNVVLTQAVVRDWMCKKVTASHPNYNNLLAYFHLDEGSGDTTYSVDGRAGILVNSPA